MGNPYLAIIEEYEQEELGNSTRANKRYDTAEEVIKAIYADTFKGAALIPVLPEYEPILGKSCWICCNEQQAARKRRTEQSLVFTIQEFKLMIDSAMEGMKELSCVINAKRTFGGVIGLA